MDGRENYICFEAIKTGNKNDPKKRELSKQREPKHSFHHTHGKRQGFRLKGWNENNSAKKTKQTTAFSVELKFEKWLHVGISVK